MAVNGEGTARGTDGSFGEDVLPLGKVSEIARRALKTLVLKGDPPIPMLYERAFFAVAMEMGEERLVSHFQQQLPPGQPAVAMVDGLLRLIGIMSRDIQESKSHLEAHEDALEQRHNGLKNMLNPGQWATVNGEISGLLTANSLLRKQLETANRRLIGLEEEVNHLQRKTRLDPLTETLNRDALREDLATEFQRSVRYHRPFALIMADIDHFKKVNDNYGHAMGDEVLKTFARMLRKDLRDVDGIYRYGGEEFVILLPETDLEGGVTVGNRLRQRVELHVLKERGDTGISIQITASFGIAVFEETDESPQEIIERGDRALYRAKTMGRNQVQAARPND